MHEPTSVTATLAELLTSLGIYHPGGAEEATGVIAGKWVEHAKDYADGLSLCRAQLRNADERTKQEVERILIERREEEFEMTWDKIIYCLMKLELRSSTKEDPWGSYSRLIRESCLTQTQLLGISLDLARQERLEVAIIAFRRLLSILPPDEQEDFSICVELITSIETGTLMKKACLSRESLYKAAALHEQMAGLLAIASGRGDNDTVGNTNRDALIRKIDSIVVSQREYPEDVAKETWRRLLQNSYATSDIRKPDMLQIESRSLPRSGHHFLKRLLERAVGEDFSYCEGYQEPGCCKESPCTAMSYWKYAERNCRPHLRLIKSHDFSLKDKTFEPLDGLIRLIQIRQPGEVLASWLELQQLRLNKELLAGSGISWSRIMLYHEKELLEEAWRLIDERGDIMDERIADKWLHDKYDYIKLFLEKWLPVAEVFPLGKPVTSGNFVLSYRALSRGSEILRSLGIKDISAKQLPRFHQPRSDASVRYSQRVTGLLKARMKLISRLDKVLQEQFPALGDML